MAQEKFKGYRIDLKVPDDEVVKRNRVARLMSFLISTGLVFVLPFLLVYIWGEMLGFPQTGIVLGILAGGLCVAWLIPPRMLIYNPEWTGYVTNDAFGGGMVAYGPGLHLSHWWETRNALGNHSLEVITRDLKAQVSTRTSQVMVSGKYEYAKDLELLTLAVGVDESTIESGLTAFIESFLTSRCASEDAETVRGKIDELNEDLAKKFVEEEHGASPHASNPANFGQKYGFITVSVVINGISLPPAVQKTRDSRDEAKQLFKVVAKMYGLSEKKLREKLDTGAITKADFDKMLNRAMAASENATMSINVVEGDSGKLITGAAADLMKGRKS